MFTILALIGCSTDPSHSPVDAGAPSPAAPIAEEAGAPDSANGMPTLVTQLDGSPMKTAGWAGKAVLFVNVASKCGNTPQYEGLQKLYDTRKDKGLVIVGVPSNQFGGQEPGSADEIAQFCKMTYGVDFPMLEKQDVNGVGRSELYTWLVNSKVGGGKDVQWNFEKFLVDKDGRVVSRLAPGTAPMGLEMTAALGKVL